MLRYLTRHLSPFLLFHVALLAALLLSLTLVADVHAFGRQAQPVVPNWYLGLTGSVNFVRDANLDGKGGLAPLRGTLEFDDGYGIGGAIGYRTRNSGTMWDNIRLEAEMSVRDNEMDQFIDTTGSVTVINDDLQVQTAMANMYIDFDLAPGWRPYIGGGIGAARLHVESTSLAIDDEDTVFAYQGMVGLYYTPESFQAAEFGVGYRYLGTSSSKFSSASTGSRTEMEYDAQNLEIGTRFYF